MKESGSSEETVRLVREIAPGFSAHHLDAAFDRQLDTFFKSGSFDADIPSNAQSDSRGRIAKLHRLENNETGVRFCTELRDGIQKNFAVGKGQRILLEAMKFMLRIHIDDKDRTDTELPGVSHQITVALNVLNVLAKKKPLDRYDATILAAAMLHDVVEDHTRLLELESAKLAALYKIVGKDKKPVLQDSDSTKKKVMTLLTYESGRTYVDAEGNSVAAPNNFMGRILNLITRDRVEMFERWHGYSHDRAVDEERKLTAKEGTPQELARNKAKKQEFYELYTLDTFTDANIDPVTKKPYPERQHAGEAASLIKIMDLRDNALTIGRIRERAEREVDKSTRDTLLKKYSDLKEKYQPVLIDICKALPGWPEDTWVGSMRNELHEEIKAVLISEYGVSPDLLP